MRTSPIHYIAPSAISIVPNCNNSANDLAVTISRGTKIKVYSPRAGIDKTTSGEYQEWTLTGRNRRLADSTKPYTIYARLKRDDYNDGYLIFVQKFKPTGDEWGDAKPYVAPSGVVWPDNVFAVFGNYDDYWYIRLGDVSLPDANNQRTVTLDTGILGTDQFNDEWALRPDELPLRIELGCTINDEDAGPMPYVYWGQSLVLTAMLTEGWTGTDIQRFDRWEIIRNSGDDAGDNAWNYPVVDTGEETEEESEETEEESEETEEESEETTTTERIMPDGQITLNHARGADDDFNGAVAVTFTILAVGHNADTLQREILRTATINIMAETVEKYELSLSESIVSYDPQTQNYTPSTGVNVGIRATDQRGEVFDMTRGQIANASLVAEYSTVGSTQWTALTFGGSSQEAATANIATTAFALQQSVNVRLMRRITADGQTVAEKELSRATIAFVRNGEDSKIREWIYRLNSNAGYDATTGTAGGTAVSGQTDGVNNCLLIDDFVPSGWSDDPTGVSQPGDVEWESWRDYDDENHRWGVFHAPVIHNRYAKDAVTFRLECNVESIRIPANETSAAQNLQAKLYQRTGIAAEEEYSCYWAIYNRHGNTFRRMYATESRRQLLSISNYSVSSDSSSAEYADAVVFVCAQQFIDGNSYSSSLPASLIAKTEIPVIKDGDTGPKGDDAQEVNPNILLRTIFDRGMDFVLEAWTRTNELISVDGATDTIVNGRKSLRMNASSQDLDFQQDVFGKVKPSTWYTLSFNYFATQSFYTFLYDASNTTPWIDLSEGYYIDGSATPTAVTRIDGLHEWEADWSGNRHSITFKTASTFSTNTLYVLFRCLQGGQVAICMPKLEEGRTATAYMAHESDLKGDNAPYNVHAYAISRSRTSHADGDLYQVNGVRWFPSAPDPMATHPYVWERIMHYTAAGVNDQTSYICLTGAVGAMGKLCYMAGEYREDVEYTSNDSQTVAVEVSGTNDTTSIYYLNAESNVVNGTHIGPTTTGQTIWVQGMNQYNLVRARYLFADFAQFGAAVVSGDWLISVHGTINGTEYHGKYEDPDTYINGGKEKPTYFWFDPAYPNEDHAGKYKTPGSSSSGQWASDHHNFIPHYAVNLLTGKTYQNDAYIRGEVHATSGDFKNVKISGGMRSPFTYITPNSTFDSDFSDNVAVHSIDTVKDQDDNVLPIEYTIPWDSSQSGRRIIVANYKWGTGELAKGFAKLNAPNGKYFYEDGVMKASIQLSREVVELIGYGDSSSFYGWIVLTRTDIGTEYKYGHHLSALAIGKVIVENGVISEGKAIGMTFDGSGMSVRRLDAGKYKVIFENTSWFQDANGVHVTVSGYGNTNNGPLYASVHSIDTTGFEVWTGDDTTLNEGSFTFIVMNIYNWLHLNG